MLKSSKLCIIALMTSSLLILYISMKFLETKCNLLTAVNTENYSLKNGHQVEPFVENILKKWNMEDTFRVLQSIGEKMRVLKTGKNIKSENCEIWIAGVSKSDGSMYGAHEICDYKPKNKEKCIFYSFGIGKNYLFDSEIANKWGCHGVAFDPSVIYPSKIHDNITFHMIAAKTLSPENDRRWPLVASVPALIRAFNHDSIKILKVDCEGCEYSLASDIEKEKINLFSIVEQFSVEVHVGRSWIQSKRHLTNLAKLYFLLEHAGLYLTYVRFSGLDLSKDELGCAKEFYEADYPCDRNTVLQNLLFARRVSRETI